jgi:hypothetical protein
MVCGGHAAPRPPVRAAPSAASIQPDSDWRHTAVMRRVLTWPGPTRMRQLSGQLAEQLVDQSNPGARRFDSPAGVALQGKAGRAGETFCVDRGRVGDLGLAPDVAEPDAGRGTGSVPGSSVPLGEPPCTGTRPAPADSSRERLRHPRPKQASALFDWPHRDREPGAIKRARTQGPATEVSYRVVGPTAQGHRHICHGRPCCMRKFVPRAGHAEHLKHQRPYNGLVSSSSRSVSS